MIKDSRINREQLDWVKEQSIDVQLSVLSNHLDICKVVINSVLQSSVTELCGERYRHTNGQYKRWGYNRGSVRVGAQRVPIDVPRVRDMAESRSVPLEMYQKMRELPEQKEELLKSVLHGISMRDYEQVSTQLIDSFGLSPSTISRQFVEASAKAVQQFSERTFEDLTFRALFIDGKYLAGQQMIIALGITSEGRKILLSVIQSTTENSTAVRQMLSDIIARGFTFTTGLLCVIDGSRGIRKALEETWGVQAIFQRCQWHKRENVVSYLPEKEQAHYRRKLQQAYQAEDYPEAKSALINIGQELRKLNLQSYNSLMEGLEETLTLHKLGLREELGRSFTTTNCIESINSQLEKYTRKVKRWMDSEQRYRWVISGLIEIEYKLRKVAGYKYLDDLNEAMNKYIKSLDPISTKNGT
jgi:transposase-like protein